ncbi:HNH homing endonuclease [Xanthomonas phage NP1]|nr:HNH homing endonuclease [Xanthomonas phage NP1]
MAKCDLTFEEVNALLAYEPDTGLLLWKVSKGTAKAGRVAGSPHNEGYLRVKVHGKMNSAHRLAWLLHTGSWPSKHLDHIDGNRANNRIDNLRECTQAENLQNKGKYSNNKSGAQGVHWNKQAKKWMAQIRVAGKNIYLGLFETLEEAAAARAAAKLKYHTFQPVERAG